MPRKPSDLQNQVFGRLTVIDKYPINDKHNNVQWNCVCSCGQKVIIRGMSLTNGHTNSCGCLRKEIRKELMTTHDSSHTSEYRSWRRMLSRCYNTKGKHYSRYGGRGITVCESWKNSFEAFYEDMGKKPTPLHTLERRDNDKNYDFLNCTWATRKEQANNRSTNTYYTLKGITKTLAQWCDEVGLKYSLVINRLVSGWTFPEAIEPSPTRYYQYQNKVGSLVKWCDLLHLNYEETFYRLKDGYPFEKIVEEASVSINDVIN